MAAKLEDQYPGHVMSRFDVHLGLATLTRMDAPTIRCRGAVAQALGVKPWEVRCRPRADGGFDLGLPNRYMPSRHDGKLDEVATAVVGRPGWYVTVDPAALTASLIPSEPPTFPALIPYPLADLSTTDRDRLMFGRRLPAAGARLGSVAEIDWKAQAFALVAGLPGSGKSVTLNAIIAGSLASGSELCVIDLPAKSLDFAWCKDMVRPGGWGCDNAEAAVTALALVYAEGERRARVLAAEGVVNWLELPQERQFAPILVVVDEVTALLVPRRVPAGIPRDHPLKVEVDQENIPKAALDRFINKIVAELRFVGIRLVLSSQVANNSTGIGPSLKAKIGHKILVGSNPSRQARTQAFNDETSVPHVPPTIRADCDAAKGSGCAELEGTAPYVFKSFYAASDDYRAALLRLGVPTTGQPEPTARQIAQHTDSLRVDEALLAPRGARRGADADPDGEPVTDRNGRPLRGIAAANARSSRLQNRS
ncbi:FtsK/SpoIIIE domain-containing protein [Nakamurella multipartita]|nr:FtsK/SpoIIIE domain-containing protein [Nakamurella multipartita]